MVKIQLRNDLLDWEPDSPTKSPEVNALSPERHGHRLSAYAHAAPDIVRGRRHMRRGSTGSVVSDASSPSYTGSPMSSSAAGVGGGDDGGGIGLPKYSAMNISVSSNIRGSRWGGGLPPWAVSYSMPSHSSSSLSSSRSKALADNNKENNISMAQGGAYANNNRNRNSDNQSNTSLLNDTSVSGGSSTRMTYSLSSSSNVPTLGPLPSLLPSAANEDGGQSTRKARGSFTHSVGGNLATPTTDLISRPGRLHSNPSILKPERQYHAPPSDLLDMDVTQLLASSIRLVQKVETSLLFKPAATFSSFGGASTMSSFTGGGADSAFPGLGKVYDEETLNGILSNSVDNPDMGVWEPPRRRGSLLDWNAEDHLQHSPRPSPFRFFQPASYPRSTSTASSSSSSSDGGTPGKDHRVQSFLEGSTAGTTTFRETSRTTASADFRSSYLLSSSSSSSSSPPPPPPSVAAADSHPPQKDIHLSVEPDTPLTASSTMTSSSIGGGSGLGTMGGSHSHLQGGEWMAALKWTTRMLRGASTEADQRLLQNAKNPKPSRAASISTSGSLPVLSAISLAFNGVAPAPRFDDQDNDEDDNGKQGNNHYDDSRDLVGTDDLDPGTPQWKRALIATRRKQASLKVFSITKQEKKEKNGRTAKTETNCGNPAMATRGAVMAVENDQSSEGTLAFSPRKDTDDRGGLGSALAAEAQDDRRYKLGTWDKSTRSRAVSSIQANVRRRQVQRAVLAQLSEDTVIGCGDDGDEDEDDTTTKDFLSPRVYRRADSPSTDVGSVSINSTLRNSAIVAGYDNDGENADDFEKVASGTHAMIEQLSVDSRRKGMEAQKIRLLEEEQQEEDSPRAKARKGKESSISHAKKIQSLHSDDYTRQAKKQSSQTDDNAQDGERKGNDGDNEETETAHLEWKLAVSQHTPGSGFLAQLHRITVAEPTAYKMLKSRLRGITKLQATVRKLIARRDLPDAPLFNFAQQHQQKHQRSGYDDTTLVLKLAYSKQEQLQQQQRRHRREQQTLTVTEAATILQCMCRKATAERAVLHRLLDHIGDVDFIGDGGGGGGGGRAIADNNRNQRPDKLQCIILEGKRWSALMLARAASPLPMPGFDPQMRARLAEQCRLYEQQQQLSLESAAGAYGRDDHGGESSKVGYETPADSEVEVEANQAKAKTKATAAAAQRREAETAAAEERKQMSTDRTAWLKARIEKARQIEAEALDAGRPPLPSASRTMDEAKDDTHRRAVLTATMTIGSSANLRQASRVKQEQEEMKIKKQDEKSGKAAVLAAVAMLERESCGGVCSDDGAAGRVSYKPEKPLSSAMAALLNADGDLHRQAEHAAALSADGGESWNAQPRPDKKGGDLSPSSSDGTSVESSGAVSAPGVPLSPPSSFSPAVVQWSSSRDMKGATLSLYYGTPSSRRDDRSLLSPDGTMRLMSTTQDEPYSVTLSLDNLDDATDTSDGATPTASLEFVNAIAEQKLRQVQQEEEEEEEEEEQVGEDDEDDRSDDHLLTFSNDNAGYYDEGFDEDAKEEAERGYQEQEYRQRGESAKGHDQGAHVVVFHGDDRDVLDDTEEDMDLVEYDDENDAEQHNAFVEFTELRSDRNDTNASFVSDTARPDSVASLAIPENEELLPPMSPYELSRRQGLAEPLAYETSVDGSEEEEQGEKMASMGYLQGGVGYEDGSVEGEESVPQRNADGTENDFENGDGEEMAHVGDQQDGADGEFYDDEAALKMEEEREALMLQGPMEVGSFAKALFDDEEHWYPCVVVARNEEQREELLEFDEPDFVDKETGEVIEEGQLKKGDVQLVVSYFYALEYFDGDVREDVSEDDAVVMLPHEAIAHAQALLDKAEAEGIPHFEDDPSAWSGALRAAAEVMAEMEAMEAEAAMAEDEETEAAAETSYSAAFQDKSSSSPLQEAQSIDTAADAATEARTAEGERHGDRITIGGSSLNSSTASSSSSISSSMSSSIVQASVQSQDAPVVSEKAQSESTAAPMLVAAVALLPEGWVTIPTGATTYYWHEGTGEVTYARPEREGSTATAIPKLVEKRENATREAEALSRKRSPEALLTDSPSSSSSSSSSSLDVAGKLRRKLDALNADHPEIEGAVVQELFDQRRSPVMLRSISSKELQHACNNVGSNDRKSERSPQSLSPYCQPLPSISSLLVTGGIKPIIASPSASAPNAQHSVDLSSEGRHTCADGVITVVPTKRWIYSPTVASSGSAGLTKQALAEKVLTFEKEVTRQDDAAAKANMKEAEEQLMRDEATAAEATEERKKNTAAERVTLQEHIAKAKRETEEKQKQAAATAADGAASKNEALSRKTGQQQMATVAKAALKRIQDSLRADRERANQKEAQAKVKDKRKCVVADDPVAAVVTSAAAPVVIAEEKRSRANDEATKPHMSPKASEDQGLYGRVKPGSKVEAREKEEVDSQQGCMSSVGGMSSVGAEFEDSGGDNEIARSGADGGYMITDEAEADQLTEQVTRSFQRDDIDDNNDDGTMEGDSAELSVGVGAAARAKGEATNSKETPTTAPEEEEEEHAEEGAIKPQQLLSATLLLSSNEAEFAAAAATTRGDTDQTPSLHPHMPLTDHPDATATAEGSEPDGIGGEDPTAAAVAATMTTQSLSAQRMDDPSDPMALAMASYRRLATRSPFSSANSVTLGCRRSMDVIDGDGQDQHTTTARSTRFKALGASTPSNSTVDCKYQQQPQPPHSASLLRSSSDDLPTGWQAVKAEEGGCYYWHVETNSVTWDHPVTGQRTINSRRSSGSSSSRKSSKKSCKSSSCRRGSKEAAPADGSSGGGGGSGGSSSERPSASMSSERQNSMSTDRMLNNAQTSPANDDDHHVQLLVLQRRLQERRSGDDASNDNAVGAGGGVGGANFAPPAIHGDLGNGSSEDDDDGENDQRVLRRIMEDVEDSSNMLTELSSSLASSASQPAASTETVPLAVAASLSSSIVVESLAEQKEPEKNITESLRVEENADRQEHGGLVELEVDTAQEAGVADFGAPSTADENEFYGYHDDDGGDNDGAEYGDDGAAMDDRTDEEEMEGNERRRQKIMNSGHHEDKLLELLAGQAGGGGGGGGRGGGVEQEGNDGNDGLRQAGAYYDDKYEDHDLLEGEEFSGEDSVVLSTVEEGDEDFSMASHMGDDTPRQSEYGGCWGDENETVMATMQQQQQQEEQEGQEGQDLGREGAASEIGMVEREKDVEFAARGVTPEFNEGDWDAGGGYYGEEEENEFGGEYAEDVAAAAEDGGDYQDGGAGGGATQDDDSEYYRNERPKEEFAMDDRRTPLSEVEQQENMDEMTDFLEHAGLGRFVEVFSHFGFGSVDDLLDPNLVMDDDLIEYCGMTEAEVAQFRGAVDAINGIDGNVKGSAEGLLGGALGKEPLYEYGDAGELPPEDEMEMEIQDDDSYEDEEAEGGGGQ